MMCSSFFSKTKILNIWHFIYLKLENESEIIPVTVNFIKVVFEYIKSYTKIDFIVNFFLKKCTDMPVFQFC